VPSAVPDVLSAAAHAWQRPLHAVSQQTPSTQLPLVHSRQPAALQSVARLQVAPCAFCAAQTLALVQ
jgi:hypothetical protein